MRAEIGLPDGLELSNRDGFCALWAVQDVELYRVSHVQRLEPITVNITVVDEGFASILGRDEAPPLGIVEPLDYAACHAYLLPAGYIEKINISKKI